MSRGNRLPGEDAGSVGVAEVESCLAELAASPAGTDATWNATDALIALAESVPCGVLVFGGEGEVRAVNTHFAEEFAYSRQELLALGSFPKLLDAISSEFSDSENAAELWRRRVEAGEACWDELELASPDHKRLERFGRPISDSNGRNIGWIEVYRDVTGQKLVEGNLLHIDRMVTLGQLVSGVAHELSNPLTSILGYAQLLRLRRHTPQGDQDVEHILREAERASRIARSVLQFGRGAKPERTTIWLNDVVRSVSALRAGQRMPSEVEIRLELDPDLPPVLGDAGQLQQVLVNLIVNAEQAICQAHRRGSICVRTRIATGDRVAIDVIDDGPGIAPEALPRIFDPFFTTKPAGVGTGLGLSIAYGIAHDHGGRISVDSRPDSGATFTIELPVTPAPPLAARSATGDATRAVAEASKQSRSERILVIEDEPAVARLIADVLTEEGHHVDIVLDSREGFGLIEKWAYALVLCDLRMPHVSGRQLFQALQEQDHPLCRRFVFVTGDALSPSTAQFLDSSGAQYLAKPFRIEELKSLVQRSLQRPPEQFALAAVKRTEAETRTKQMRQKGRRQRR